MKSRIKIINIGVLSIMAGCLSTPSFAALMEYEYSGTVSLRESGVAEDLADSGNFFSNAFVTAGEPIYAKFSMDSATSLLDHPDVNFFITINDQVVFDNTLSQATGGSEIAPQTDMSLSYWQMSTVLYTFTPTNNIYWNEAFFYVNGLTINDPATTYGDVDFGASSMDISLQWLTIHYPGPEFFIHGDDMVRVETVPLPSALLLFGSALASLVGVRLRRKKT